MHFFILVRIKGLCMFEALLAHPQEALHKQHLVRSLRVMCVGCYQDWSGTPALLSDSAASCDNFLCFVDRASRYMHYLSLFYSVTIPAIPQLQHNITSSIPTRPANSQVRRTTRTNCHIYTELPPDDGLLVARNM
jgi:hypothetical protein